MIHRYETPCMDLQQIHQSGQCFRMVPLPEHTYPSGAKNGYRLISGLRVLRAWQDGPFVCLDCPHEDLSFWLSYLDMDRDYQAVIASIDRENTYLRAAAMSGTGIRILRQDPWEMIITFILSQQNNIPRIKGLIRTLCERYGERCVTPDGRTYDTFPRAEDLAQATEEELRELKLGYRSKYICGTARMVAEGDFDLGKLKGMAYEDARAELVRLPGIGGKVADCICLFALHQMDAFPVDTHIKKALELHYPEGFPFTRYQRCAGVMQQYIFYYDLRYR